MSRPSPGVPAGVDGRDHRSLWRQPDFAMLWCGATASWFGARVSLIVIPLVAVHSLGATPMEMGLLAAAQTVGVLLVGLPAGAVVDRVRRRRLLVGMEMLRGLCLLAVAVAAAAGVLGLVHLFVAALWIGIAAVFFDLAQQSHLPALVSRDRLVEANASLQASTSVATVAGPSLGGAAVALLGGVATLFGSALLSFASALALGRLRADPPPAEPVPGAPAEARHRRLWAETVVGLRYLMGERVLRAIACCTGSMNLFTSMILTLAVLYLAHDLRLPASATGLLLAAGGAGGVLAAFTVRWWTAWLGQARSLWLVLLVTRPFGLLLPLAGAGWRTILFGAGWLVLGYGGTAYNIVQVSFRQSICPDRLLGRVSAANRVLAVGTVPVGALIAGALGTALGIRATLGVAVAGLCASVLWLVCSPLTRSPAGSAG